MTGFIGYCLKNGAFLSADTRRTNPITGEIDSQVVQKIHLLKSNVMVATGGLGTYGHQAREILSSSIENKTTNIDEIISIASPIFKQVYEESLISHPNHNVPLYAIFAGYDNRKSSGFIKVLQSSDMYKEVFEINNPGQPYFTGSNTRTVIRVASDQYYNLMELDNKLNLDLWSFNSFKDIIKHEKSIGFPIQISIIKEDNYFTKYPIAEDEIFNHHIEFETEFITP